MAARLYHYDCHNHLIDQRIDDPDLALDHCVEVGLRYAVVNSAHPADWNAVLAFQQRRPNHILASIGPHPWFLDELETGWLETYETLLASHLCGVGEVGLDKWMRNPNLPAQREVLRTLILLAHRYERPLTIHCLRAWGTLLEILQSSSLPKCGFLLHAYSGPAEMAPKFVDLGAYFSFSGYFGFPRKRDRWDVFRQLPKDRILIETDAPDMTPPEDCREFVFETNPTTNHPANIRAIYSLASSAMNWKLEDMAERVDTNFHRLFGGLIQNHTPPT